MMFRWMRLGLSLFFLAPRGVNEQRGPKLHTKLHTVQLTIGPFSRFKGLFNEPFSAFLPPFPFSLPFSSHHMQPRPGAEWHLQLRTRCAGKRYKENSL